MCYNMPTIRCKDRETTKHDAGNRKHPLANQRMFAMLTLVAPPISMIGPLWPNKQSLKIEPKVRMTSQNHMK